jgi:hypothetical protein
MNLGLHNHSASVNANLPPVVSRRLKLDHAINKGIKGIILTYTDIIAGVDAGASLPNQNSPGVYLLSIISLHAKPL